MINTMKKAIEFETPSLPNFIRAKANELWEQDNLKQ